MTTTPDPAALLRSRNYLRLLVLAAIIGAPISVVAYFFLTLVTKLQQWIFTDLPKSLGFHGTPLWWPIPFLALAGLLVGLTLRYLPGTGGHSPAEGFKAGGPRPPIRCGPSGPGPGMAERSRASGHWCGPLQDSRNRPPRGHGLLSGRRGMPDPAHGHRRQHGRTGQEHRNEHCRDTRCDLVGAPPQRVAVQAKPARQLRHCHAGRL